MWDKYKHIIPHISVGTGVINTVADWVLSCGYKNILVVCDPNTHRVAGEFVIAALRNAEITVSECRFIENEPLPDEYSVGFVLSSYTPDVDLIMGVGSGTINDICTYIGAQVGCPSAIVGTAPSMDGYASLGSAMLFGGIKVTPMTQCPVAIFCDIDILAAAPMNMIAAGLGDMLGKITALADWRLSHILTCEDIPQAILDIMETALERIIAGAPYAAGREPAVIQSITEGLILSGIAMALYGDSRPASGTEHHLAHFWEMRLLEQGKIPALHGIKVGLGTVIGLVMWKNLVSGLPRRKQSLLLAMTADYENDIRRLYGRSADEILQTQNPNLDAEHIKKHWIQIETLAKSLPSPEDVAAMLSLSGERVCPSEIDLDADMLRDSIIYARDRKRTYTVLQLLGDLGLLENYAGRVQEYFTKNALAGARCFVLDMDGTIYLGEKLFPFTLDFLQHLKEKGMDYIFYTNNSSQNAVHYIEKLQRMGISIPKEKLLMSTHVLLDYLTHTNHTPDKARVYIAGTKALVQDFTDAGYTITDEKPDFVVLGFDTDMDFGRLTRLCDFIRNGVPAYGVNMDYNCPVEGGFIPDCGSLAAAVKTSTGKTLEFFGKPSRFTLDYIIAKTGYREEELCFIGDRLYTDIAITRGTKARSVLVLSGETKTPDLASSEYVPDVVAEDLSKLIL
ncbi:MAG: iron-containing alcohol dehydrogenase [Oscillospiraceae bacterium]|nr:iron-containing alcohol dehydrogenase [Oscillospiraceae bacterium]